MAEKLESVALNKRERRLIELLRDLDPTRCEVCGFFAKKKFGLTNHQNKCLEKNAEAVENHNISLCVLEHIREILGLPQDRLQRGWAASNDIYAKTVGATLHTGSTDNILLDEGTVTVNNGYITVEGNRCRGRVDLQNPESLNEDTIIDLYTNLIKKAFTPWKASYYDAKEHTTIEAVMKVGKWTFEATPSLRIKVKKEQKAGIETVRDFEVNFGS